MGEQAYKEVVRLFRNETNEWYHITANGEELVCTGGHPFFVENKGFVLAKDLSVGDILRLSNGALIPVSSISIERLIKPEITYNFEVADFHTYYVGESEVLVHNTCMLDPNDIKYSQDSISNKFGKNTAHAGESVDDLIESLKNGAITPNDIEPLDVFTKNGQIYSMNNRRLFAYKMAGVKSVPVRWVPESSLRHVITGNGVDIIVRGGSRFL